MIKRSGNIPRSFFIARYYLICLYGLNFDFKRVLLFGILLYHHTRNIAHGQNLRHCGRYQAAPPQDVRHRWHTRTDRCGAGTRDPSTMRDPPRPHTKSGESRRVGKVAKVAKVAKVGAFIKSGKLSKSKKLGNIRVGKLLQCSPKSRLRVAIRVGRVDSRESRRVAQVPLSNIVCTIVGVVMHVRCNHIFGLILITKVVLA